MSSADACRRDTVTGRISPGCLTRRRKARLTAAGGTVALDEPLFRQLMEHGQEWADLKLLVRGLRELGLEPLPSSPEQMAAVWARDDKYWPGLIRTRGISAE